MSKIKLEDLTDRQRELITEAGRLCVEYRKRDRVNFTWAGLRDWLETQGWDSNPKFTTKQFEELVYPKDRKVSTYFDWEEASLEVFVKALQEYGVSRESLSTPAAIPTLLPVLLPLEEHSKKTAMRALVFVDDVIEEETVHLTYVPETFVWKSGRRKYVSLLKRGDKLEFYDPYRLTLDSTTPGELFVDVVQPEVSELYKRKPSGWHKLQTGLYVTALVVIGIILFLVIVVLLGGGA